MDLVMLMTLARQRRRSHCARPVALAGVRREGIVAGGGDVRWTATVPFPHQLI